MNSLYLIVLLIWRIPNQPPNNPKNNKNNHKTNSKPKAPLKMMPNYVRSTSLREGEEEKNESLERIFSKAIE